MMLRRDYMKIKKSDLKYKVIQKRADLWETFNDKSYHYLNGWLDCERILVIILKNLKNSSHSFVLKTALYTELQNEYANLPKKNKDFVEGWSECRRYINLTISNKKLVGDF